MFSFPQPAQFWAATARRASYVYASDHSISANVNYEDFKYAIEVYRGHMMY